MILLLKLYTCHSLKRKLQEELGEEIVKSHIYFVYTEFVISHIFFYPRRNMQDFYQYEILPPIHLYLGCLISLTSLWHGRQWFCYNVNINNTVQLAETKG